MPVQVEYTLELTADGTIIWDGTAIPDVEMAERVLAAAAMGDPWAPIHLKPDSLTPFRAVAGVMAILRRVGFRNLGFVGNTQVLPRAHLVEIGADGTMRWDGTAVDGMTELTRYYGAAANEQPQPKVNIKADRSTQYQFVINAVGAAQRTGLRKVGFVAHTLDVAADGTAIWDGKNGCSLAEVETDLAATAIENPRARIHLASDELADRPAVADILAIAQRVGLTDLGVGNKQASPDSPG